jgi:hypothetical protein
MNSSLHEYSGSTMKKRGFTACARSDLSTGQGIERWDPQRVPCKQFTRHLHALSIISRMCSTSRRYSSTVTLAGFIANSSNRPFKLASRRRYVRALIGERCHVHSIFYFSRRCLPVRLWRWIHLGTDKVRQATASLHGCRSSNNSTVSFARFCRNGKSRQSVCIWCDASTHELVIQLATASRHLRHMKLQIATQTHGPYRENLSKHQGIDIDRMLHKSSSGFGRLVRISICQYETFVRNWKAGFWRKAPKASSDCILARLLAASRSYRTVLDRL